MTNGEMIQKVFTCEVCEPIIEDDIIHVIFADKKDSAIGFDWSWWNVEYKELNCSEIPTGSTIKNDLGVDCISRAEAIKCLECDFDITGKENMKTVVNYINSAHDKIMNLPRVEQEPKVGHWIDISKYKDIAWQCSECEHFTTMKHNYCPNCGAKMVEPQESEDKE